MIQAVNVSVIEEIKLRTEEIEEEVTDRTSETARTAVGKMADPAVGEGINEVVVVTAGSFFIFSKSETVTEILDEICRDRGGSRERPKRGDVESEVMSLEAGEIAYLLGRNGATKQRLASFSGARLEIDPHGGLKTLSRV